VAAEWMLYRLLHCTHWLVQPRIDDEEGQLCWLSAAMVLLPTFGFSCTVLAAWLASLPFLLRIWSLLSHRH